VVLILAAVLLIWDGTKALLKPREKQAPEAA
jgi:hypothetical protein